MPKMCYIEAKFVLLVNAAKGAAKQKKERINENSGNQSP